MHRRSLLPAVLLASVLLVLSPVAITSTVATDDGAAGGDSSGVVGDRGSRSLDGGPGSQPARAPAITATIEQGRQHYTLPGPGRSKNFTTLSVTFEGEESIHASRIHLEVNGQRTHVYDIRDSGRPVVDFAHPVLPCAEACEIEAGETWRLVGYGIDRSVVVSGENQVGDKPYGKAFYIGWKPDDAGWRTYGLEEDHQGETFLPKDDVRLIYTDADGEEHELASHTVEHAPPYPDLELGQVDLANVFETDENARVEVVTAGDRFEWELRDYWGRTVAEGTETNAHGATTFAPPIEEPGYYELFVTARDGEERVGTANTTLAIVEPYDVGAVDPADSIVGMNTGMAFREHTAQLDLVATAGIKHIRDAQRWAWIEERRRASDGSTHFHRAMDHARSLGLEPMLMMQYGNGQYYDLVDGDTHTPPHTEPAQRAYAEYAIGLLDRYPQVNSIELWNEMYMWRALDPPDGKTAEDVLGRTKGELYRDLVDTAYPRITAEHPDVTVGGVGGAGNPDWEPGATFLDEIFGTENTEPNGALQYMDVVTIHPYRHRTAPEGYGQQPHRGSVRDEIQRIQGRIEGANDGESMPIWITEIGWRGHAYRDTIYTARDQARFVPRSIAMAKAAGVERYYWYTIRDKLNDRGETSYGMGILREQGRVVRQDDRPLGGWLPKRSYLTMAVTARQLSETDFVGDDGLEDVYSYRFEDEEGKTTRVVWANETKEVTVTASGPVSVTDAVGVRETYEPLEGTISLTASEDPVYVEGPVTDVSTGSPFSIQLANTTQGATSTATVRADESLRSDVTVAVGEETATLSPGGSVSLSIQPTERVGERTVHATVRADRNHVGRLQASQYVDAGSGDGEPTEGGANENEGGEGSVEGDGSDSDDGPTSTGATSPGLGVVAGLLAVTLAMLVARRCSS